jgi:hypothetical protein
MMPVQFRLTDHSIDEHPGRSQGADDIQQNRDPLLKGDIATASMDAVQAGGGVAPDHG